MKNTLKLENPITVNGKEIIELTYDPQKITVEQFSLASAKAGEISKTKAFRVSLRENDYNLHLYLGMMAIIAVNPDIDLSDLERVVGFDLLAIADIGMLFTLRRQAAVSEQTSSDEQ